VFKITKQLYIINVLITACATHYKFIVVNGQTTTSKFYKSTVLGWGGQNYDHFCQVVSWFCLPKIIKIGKCFTKLFKK